MNEKKQPRNNCEKLIPQYLRDVYFWSYLNPKNIKLLDREIVVKTILWGQHNKLKREAFKPIQAGSSVLQVAAVYGVFSKKLAETIGTDGTLKIIDVAPVQVEHTTRKLQKYQNVTVAQADASTFTDTKYDTVLCYFLLHEVPDDYKTKIIDNLLQHITPNGKVIIVDYHKPHWAHPLKLISSIVFDTLEPFAKTLWRKTIRELATSPDDYNWQSDTFFGGLFQRVIVTQQKSPENTDTIKE
ncbi:MAG: rhodoquinone biosynthesis methyltransferase RquA [Gammaproteobacteria bacterium]|nr:rhodoquinone biosynthesis methyltransferase RquA [Gammaproteobacteria bacterium]